MKRLVVATSVVAVGLLAGRVRAESPPSGRTWSVPLEGCQLTPVATTGASGNAVVQLMFFNNEMQYSVSFGNLGSAEVSAHIHGPALRGEDGPIVFTLPLGSPKQGQITLTDQQRIWLESGRYYLDIHSTDLPGGELRGQIDDGGSACPPPVDAAVPDAPGPPIDAPAAGGIDAAEGDGNPGGGCGGCAGGGGTSPASALLVGAALLAIRRRR